MWVRGTMKIDEGRNAKRKTIFSIWIANNAFARRWKKDSLKLFHFPSPKAWQALTIFRNFRNEKREFKITGDWDRTSLCNFRVYSKWHESTAMRQLKVHFITHETIFEQFNLCNFLSKSKVDIWVYFQLTWNKFKSAEFEELLRVDSEFM